MLFVQRYFYLLQNTFQQITNHFGLTMTHIFAPFMVILWSIVRKTKDAITDG